MHLNLASVYVLGSASLRLIYQVMRPMATLTGI